MILTGTPEIVLLLDLYRVEFLKLSASAVLPFIRFAAAFRETFLNGRVGLASREPFLRLRADGIGDRYYASDMRRPVRVDVTAIGLGNVGRLALKGKRGERYCCQRN